MDIRVLDEELRVLGLLDHYHTLLWNDRYQGYGEFEIKAPATEENIALLTIDRYLVRSDSEHVMVIEGRRIATGQDGDHIQISGRSAESFLERRVIPKQTVLSGSFQNGVRKLLRENLIAPSDPARKYERLTFQDSSDPAVTAPALDTQFLGDNLYDVVQAGCSVNGLGFRMARKDTAFLFSLYAGKDRSFQQTENPYVIFSPGFDNLISSDYEESVKDSRNLCYAVGEGSEGNSVVVEAYQGNGAPAGLKRRELYAEISGASQQTDDGAITQQEYLAQLKARGLEELEDNAPAKRFEAEADTAAMFRYGKDFFLGDIVQVENEHGIKARARVSEIVTTYDESGLSVYPTFTFLEEE